MAPLDQRALRRPIAAEQPVSWLCAKRYDGHFGPLEVKL